MEWECDESTTVLLEGLMPVKMKSRSDRNEEELRTIRATPVQTF